ncbi:dephospho-CoA kinase [Gemmatimonas groenlandica]|uniref:Dephospho-CoA kinase n=1 Tax=Gemmatimonas groenlandica TaxID=2732249 RepID=A0A6M4IPX1_9BACT|nr:dephospho-CoA kinase [Gemmatimonas groenlandica]QJR36018.1 dephospho-CoA kinase [Gemmatimonas groenlandica]
MLHLALTGNIASGKSTVASLLAAHGATIIDADLLARDAVRPGTAALDAIVERFGPSAVQPDGTLDRPALRRRVFRDPVARDALNAIVHPAVGRLRDEQVAAARRRGDAVVISDIPLLFEVGLEHAFDGVILVDAPESERLARLQRDRGLLHEEAQAMIDAQWSSSRKRSGATWIIDNDGPREQLPTLVAELWQTIQALPLRGSSADTSL